MVAARWPDKGEVEQLTKEFLAESQEGLGQMEFCLIELEKHPDNGELVSEIFRAVHTIKGTTGFLGFTRMQALAHAGEHLLGALRDKKLAVNSKLIDGLLKLMDGLRAILQLIAATGTEGERTDDDDSELIEYLTQLKENGAKPPASGELSPQPQVMEQLAPLQTMAPERTESMPRPTPSGEQSTVGVERRAARIRPLAETEAAVADSAMQKRELRRPVDEMVSVTASSSSSIPISDPSVRIDVEVLNRMMNQVGELVLTRNQILRCAPGANNFPELARRLDSVTAELRETVMQARMQPVGHLFSKFPRLVRDLGVTCGRRVRLEFEGQDTGLDKSLMEAIRDPLTHAVRNAVDHGIEPPVDRVKAGKPIEGMVRLRAFHQSGSVVIEVIDDGTGISTEQVLAKAIERGLTTPEEAAAMTSREALQLIFVAGFSTAKEVTSVSGRGVGMDVVRANVEKVGGRVELESRVGFGTTIRMRVPLTLAIVPALVVHSGGENFALPQNALAELIYVPQRETEQSMEQIGTTEVYRLRESLLPLVWLDRLLGLQQSKRANGVGVYIAVVESEGRRFGLVVDDLKAPEEIVVKPLSAELREIGIFSGATVLGNGALALILDVAATGARAGVRPVANDVTVTNEPAEETRSDATQIELESSMVIYETLSHDVAKGGNTERMAMPLSAVERIESVPVAEIEYASGRAVLQYRGELIPLEDEGGVLREIRAGEESVVGVRKKPGKIGRASGREIAQPSGSMATVLICMRPEAHGPRRVGIVVRSVLDVSAGTLLAEDTTVCEGQLAMVKKRVTMVHGEFSRRAALPPMENMKEVA